MEIIEFNLVFNDCAFEDKWVEPYLVTTADIGPL